MKEHKVGIIMNGVTGRMGTNQHLLRSIAAIIKEGGVKVSPTEVIMPDPILVGRNETKLKALCEQSGVEKYTTDLDSVMKDDHYQIYFDSQTTSRRAKGVEDAAAAGKHVYCEKPTAVDVETAVSLFKTCEKAGVKNGVVQDKLWLPGLAKLQRLIDTGFFGRIFSVTGDFGYWVFEGDSIPAQRPSWNYRKEDDGGMIIDMVCHWRYVLANLFGKIESVSCLGATHIPERVDEYGKTYKATADDAAYTTFQIEGGVVAHINSNWCTRPRRDDLFMMQVDGTKGSAVVSLRDCWFQPYSGTPKPVWNPDIEQPINFYEHWQKMPEQENFDNAFKVQWEKFLRHVVLDEPFKWDLLEGARGVQLAELALKSWAERRWVDVEDLV